MLAEVIAHAMVQINDPASRSRRPQSDLPRLLNRVILSLPTATSVQEQAMIRSRVQGALTLVKEMLGIKDVVSKSIGSQNPYNMIRATMDGLKKESSPRSVASRRGKKVADILPKRDEAPAPAEA